MTLTAQEQMIAGRLDALLARLDRMAEERDALLEENRALRQDVMRMQREMMRLLQPHADRSSAPGGFESPDRETSHGRVAERRMGGTPRLAESHPEESRLPVPVLRTQRTEEPRAERPRESEAWAPAPASELWGRGLEPEQLGDVTPAPGRAIPRRDLDLGYINRVSEEELDRLPYGLVVLDVDGDVLFYNETEARYAGFRRESVVGRNFFRDIAPCTRVKEFQGRFNDFVAGRSGRVHFFDFVFHFAHGSQSVLIGLAHGREHGTINVMMTRR